MLDILAKVPLYRSFRRYGFPKYEGLAQWAPDSYVTEIAEERVELDTVDLSITPSLADYSQAADFQIERLKNHPSVGISRVTQAFRLQY